MQLSVRYSLKRLFVWEFSSPSLDVKLLIVTAASLHGNMGDAKTGSGEHQN